MPTDTFTYTGSDQTWNTPSDVDRVLLNVYGAGGGDASSSSSGGYSTAEDPGDQGARAQGELAVSGGQTLTITVGGQGGQGNNSGGWPDGGSGQKTTAQAINGDTCQTLSGGGGGASRVDDGSGDVIVAGGGGGGGGSATTSSYDTVSTYAGAGGYGGSPNGQNGEDANKYNGGAGADQGCGGSSPNGSDGAAEVTTYTSQCGGGGGGGYCGGGGGAAGQDGTRDVIGGAGGGGGSSYVGGMSSDTSMTADTRTGDGLVEITYIGQPQNVSVGSVGFRSATVSWDSVTGADEYRIYRNGTQIATVASGTTSYDDTNLSPDTSYSWTVSAVEGTLEGQESASVSATTGGAAPTGVTLDVTVEDEISVTWTDNTSNEAGFEIHYATTSGVDTTTSPEATVTTNTTSTTLTGLSDGEKYYIRVVAYDSDGDLGIDSNEVSGITVLPAPTSFSVSNVTADSADLSWTDNHDYGDTEVQYKRSSNANYTTFSTLSRGTEVETLTGLLNGEEYDVRIVATTEHTSTVDA